MSTKPFFLVTNDDGIHAPGIKALVEALSGHAELLVIAPAAERSGFSQAITLMTRFRVERIDERTYAVDGTPADCVVFGLFHVLKGRRPDWVVSGVNRGANLGDDTLYSGTVGAAMEGAINGLRGLAVSLVTEKGSTAVHHFDSAAGIAAQVLKEHALWQEAKGRVININVPNVPQHAVKGIAITELSRRHYDKNLAVENDADGSSFCSYGSGPVGHDGVVGNDAHAIDHGYAAVSVLRPSMFDSIGNDILRKTLATDLLGGSRTQHPGP